MKATETLRKTTTDLTLEQPRVSRGCSKHREDKDSKLQDLCVLLQFVLQTHFFTASVASSSVSNGPVFDIRVSRRDAFKETHGVSKGKSRDLWEIHGVR